MTFPSEGTPWVAPQSRHPVRGGLAHRAQPARVRRSRHAPAADGQSRSATAPPAALCATVPTMKRAHASGATDERRRASAELSDAAHDTDQRLPSRLQRHARRRTDRPDLGATRTPTPSSSLRTERSLFVVKGLFWFFSKLVPDGYVSVRSGGRGLVPGSGVAWPKSRYSGCEPAALASVSFSGCPPGPCALAAAAARRASAWRRAKMASLTRRLRQRSASLGVLPSASLRS
jgi:hypothetical protein